MRLSALLPLAFAIAAFILSMLCLFAGSEAGFMEEYNIVTLNTTGLFQDLINTTSTSSTSSDSSSSTLSWLEGELDNITSTIENGANNLLNTFVDEVKNISGVEPWYSLHMMNMCEGDYLPNATSPGATKNISSCTKPKAIYHLDPDTFWNNTIINETLSAYDLVFDSSNVQEEVTDKIHSFNALSTATSILFIIGIAFSGLAILSSLAGIFLQGRLFAFVNVSVAFLAFLFLGVGSAILTVLMVKIVNLIDRYQSDLGIVAYKGGKFLAISWAAVGSMLLASIIWSVLLLVGHRQARSHSPWKFSKGCNWKA